MRMLLFALTSWLLLGCVSAPTATDSAAGALLADHRRAVHEFQQLDRAAAQPGANDACLQRCDASDRACVSAARICADDSAGEACAEARVGCDWTTTLLPRRCGYCTTYQP